MVEGIADEVWLCDAQGRMSLVNHPEVPHIGLEQFTDKFVEQILEEIEICYPDGRPRPKEQSPLLRSLRGEVVRGQEIMRHRASGRTRWRQFSSAPIRNAAGTIVGAVAIAWDITEHKRLEEALCEARDQLELRVRERTAELEASHAALAELEQELLGISEREQQRIACDLHDGLGQQLVAIAFGANALERSLSARGRPEATEARQMCEQLDRAITDARRLSRGLQPVRQDEAGLMDALEELALTTSSVFKTCCRFQCPQPVWLADNRVATHLFRIAQEAVTNANKHGHASRVLISLRQQRDYLCLRVRDNGQGLPVKLAAPQGMGLRIMQHRADLIGAALQVEPAVKRGTLVTCKLSLPQCSPMRPKQT